MKRGRDWLIIILGSIVAVRLAGNVWSLNKSGRLVKQAEKELAEAKKENDNLKKRWEEVQSEEFIEKEAREKLGLGKEGETIIILPNNDANHKSQTPSSTEPNWHKWWELYILASRD